MNIKRLTYISLLFAVLVVVFDAHAAEIPASITIRFTDDRGKIIDTLPLTPEQFELLKNNSSTIADFLAGVFGAAGQLSLPISNVNQVTLEQIISLLQTTNKKIISTAVNNMVPEEIINVIKGTDFLGIKTLNKVNLSNKQLKQLAAYIIQHPEELDKLTIAVENTPFLNTLYGLIGHSKNTLRDTSSVYPVAWSSDGNYLASGLDNGTVHIWDVATSSIKHTLTGHTSSVLSVAWSPDGNYLASGSLDGTVRIWNTINYSQVRALTGNAGAMTSVAWSPDGNYLASGSLDGIIPIWDARDGSLVQTLTGITSPAWSPDGRYIASGSADKTVCIWNVTTGSIKYTLKGHTDLVRSVAWSSDGRYIASGSRDASVCIWDVSTGSVRYTLKGHTSPVISVVWSPDSNYLASGASDKTICIWSARNGSLMHTLTGDAGAMKSLAWSPDGNYLASGASYGIIPIWDMSLLPYMEKTITAAQVLVYWLVINTNNPNDITANIIEMLPRDLIDHLIRVVKEPIARRLKVVTMQRAVATLPELPEKKREKRKTTDVLPESREKRKATDVLRESDEE